MRPEIEKMIDRVREIMDNTDGVPTDEANRLLDEAWNLVTADPKNQEVLSLPITDMPDNLTLEDLPATQASIDREILEMLNLKELEFESMARERPLTDEELELKAKLSRFEMKSMQAATGDCLPADQFSGGNWARNMTLLGWGSHEEGNS